MKQNNFTPARVSLVFLLAFFLQLHLYAEIVCSVQPGELGILEISPTCQAVLNENNMLDDGNTCLPPFHFLMRTLQGDTLGYEVDELVVNLENYVGDTVLIKVIDFDENDECEAMYLVRSEDPPAFTACQNDTIYCSESIDPALLNPVTATSGCGSDVDLTFVDSLDENGFDCSYAPPFFGTIYRTYTAEDDGGMTATCVQEILVYQTPLDSLMFPADITIDCNDAADTTFTGRPTIRGRTFENDGICDVDVLFEDDTIALCGGSQLIQRAWAIVYQCSPTIVRDTQDIYLLDTTPPTIMCPGAIAVNTDPEECFATVSFPAPVVSDDCSSVMVEVYLNGDQVPNPLSEEVDKGSYTVEYKAIDACNNRDSCTVSLTVTDTETPTATCIGIKDVSLTNNGTGVVFAPDFNNGSVDNCPQPLTFLVSRDGDPFGPSVLFDCDDIGTPVMVTLQVTETVNNPLLSNTCMTTVHVFDKLPPVLMCPDDDVVDCDIDYSDLSAAFGDPFVMDGCGFVLEVDSTITIDNCSEGTIVRTFTATDPSDNEVSCTQTIELVNMTPFDGTGIQFPDDYTVTTNCITPSQLEPSDLPPGLDEPVPPANVPCAMFATSYSDQIFYFDFPACYKIVRTWKVMDWCQYDPAVPGVGIWQEQQVIAVMDTVPPVITFCPPDSTYSLNNDCTVSPVVMAPVTGTVNCPNEDLIITNDSPYAFDSGADASGNYPAGVHTINFTVTDGCGNEVSCSTVITVTDLKRPTPFCKDGLITELQFMANATPEIMAVVEAHQLNDKSFDNCTDPEDLVFTMRFVGDTDPTVPLLVFDCDGEGEHDVEIWVTDEAGNSDFCETKVYIQDNMDLCPNNLVSGSAMISGNVTTFMSEELADVHVEEVGGLLEDMTDGSGAFNFPGLNLGQNYLLEPWKNDDPMNGITTFDLVIMSRHVLNIQPLDSPYKLIAADINNSGSVTTADIVQLRKMILQIYTDFPNNTSWRFVDAGYVFPNPSNPFDPAFPEAVQVLNLNQDVYDANFVGVKIGDLNMSATVNFSSSAGDDRSQGEMNLITEDRKVEAGEEFLVPFRLKELNTLLALQFTLEFETDLELQGLEKGILSGASGDRFETSLLREGILTGNWYQTTPVRVAEDETLFSLRFSSKKAGMLSDMLALTSSATLALGYDEAEVPLALNLSFEKSKDMQAQLSFQLHQNQPNPFKKVTHIGFTLPEASQAQLTIYDVSGEVIRTYNRQFVQGYNEISIQRNELPSGGVLYYQLQTPKHNATKKMILLK